VERLFKLLVVDDEAIEREALKFIVKNSGLEISEVREAANGQEALSIAEEFCPHIVTLDILMPGLSGIEVGRILRERYPGMKTIFVTAYDSLEYTHEAIKIGVEEFIVKPGSNEKTLEILRSCIRQLEEELRKERHRESLESKIKQISGYLKNEFVNSVVSGEIDENQAEEYLKFMLDEFDEGFGVVIDVDFSGNSNASHVYKTMTKKRIAEQLYLLLEPDKDIRFMMSQAKNTFYLLVFGYLPDMRSHCMRLIEDKIRMIGEDLEEQLSVKLYYGFGDKYNKISQLWKSFIQANAAARNMSVIENSDTGHMNRNNLEITENDLCLSICNGMDDAVIQKADHILDNIIFDSHDMNEAKLKLFEFFMLMSRYLNRESQMKHAIPENIFDDLRNIESVGEAKKYVHECLYEIFRVQKEQGNDRTTDVMDKAVEYIHDNYCKNLTLEEVAYEVGFSTYYFGKLFKKTFGVTFTEYLTNFRIAQAKKLLSDPNLTVKGVTYRVGFMDPNYFTRVFRKSEGMTPTEYRTKLWKLGAE